LAARRDPTPGVSPVQKERPLMPFSQTTVLRPGRHLIRFDVIEAQLTATKDRQALLGNRRFRRMVFDSLDRMIGADDGKPGLLSLDVFDTLLLRDGSSEVRRFGEIGARMAQIAGRETQPIDALVARHLGTKASYRAGPRVDGCGEGSLREIHETAARILGLPATIAQAFIEAEIACEAGCVFPNTLLISYIRKHQARGGKTVLISDMYMHADQIAELLARAGVRPDLYDALYSSADTKVSKASGGIFGRVTEAADASHVLHVGDSLLGDYLKPREFGWRAMLMPVPATLLEERRRDHAACIAELWQKHRLNLEGEIAA
jgi:FMN phosphatase YigB (HAD superfamily)